MKILCRLGLVRDKVRTFGNLGKGKKNVFPMTTWVNSACLLHWSDKGDLF
jgi:hypothetical protein